MKTYLIQGAARYAKIVGLPRNGYGTEPGNGDPEWSVDLVLDDKGKKEYLASGADKFYIKTDKASGAEFVRFVRKAKKKDGTEGKPIRIVDHKGQDWDGKTLIGNDSVLNVSYSLNEVPSKGVKRMKPSILSVQVWSLEKFKAKSDFPVRVDGPEDRPEGASLRPEAATEAW